MTKSLRIKFSEMLGINPTHFEVIKVYRGHRYKLWMKWNKFNSTYFIGRYELEKLSKGGFNITSFFAEKKVGLTIGIERRD